MANPLHLGLHRVYYGWWIVLLGSLIIAVGAGILIHGFTVFFLPLKRDLAVSSAAISLIYGAARLEGGAEGPLVGYLVDRWGPRAMMLTGALLAGTGFILLSLVQTFWQFFYIYIFIISLGFNAGFFHPVYAAVNSWFIRKRGIGFALTGVAASIGGMVTAPLLSSLILAFGWRTAAVISGVIILAVAVPAALPIRRNPESIGLLPDGIPKERNAADGPSSGPEPAPQREFTVTEALRVGDFWILLFAIALRVSITVGLTIHFVPLFVWKGQSEAASAYLVSLFALSTIPITLICGWFGDRWDKSLICGLGVLPTMAGMLFLICGHSGISLYALPVGLAITMGTVPLNWALIGDFFGRRSYGTLRGIMVVGTGLGTFLSPIYAGWTFDRSGSYAPTLWTFFVVHLLAAVLFFILHRRSPRRREPKE
ncbi:MAG: MFS transporter [Syntrophaceae bacterium]|nr:MFS transporter [Syntrophaceae bacterium]